MSFAWTDERIARLKQLHAEGCTASQIQRQIGAPTRNTVCGKINRLGLKGNSSNETRRQISRLQHRGASKRSPKFNFARKSKQPPVGRRAEAGKASQADPSPDGASLHPLNIILKDLNPKQCRYPYGEEAPFVFCAHAVEPDSSYCSYHKLLCESR